MKTRKLSFLLLMLIFTGHQLWADDTAGPDFGQREKLGIVPEVVLPGTNVMVVLHYMSTDGCPDFTLVKDSVVDHKVYVTKNPIIDSTRFCTLAISYFTAKLELGTLAEGTEIYVDGKLMRTIQYGECRPNRLGLVMEGKSACEGKLIVRDISNLALSVVLIYSLPDTDEASKLKAGDKIKYAFVPVPRDSAKTDSCRVQGMVTCFELIVPEPAFSLSGVALAGADTVMYGRAVLIGKKHPRAVAQTSIFNGKFVFANIPQGDYTVQVLPDRQFYRRYLPTFYIDKLRIKEADYFTLNQDVDTIGVRLAEIKTRTGKGRVDGKVTYENEKLRDSVYTNRPQKAPAADVAYDVTVMLLDRYNQIVAWTQTDDNGRFEFPDIATEGYRVVCETTTSEAESSVSLSSSITTASVDLVLRAPSEATGVGELTTNRMSISPTLVTDVMVVTLADAARLVVYTLQGQQVMTLQLEAGEHHLSTTQLQKGIHLISIPGEVHKFVKQ
jgi:hypothetical protein